MTHSYLGDITAVLVRGVYFKVCYREGDWAKKTGLRGLGTS